ncbi:T9SS type A sorting domain-containing protein [Aquimarina aggregata]|uniref:T9SS type A sorting domain-containing protein n=1 Tax=Aquimarina aggregata TaxID=1642818 RepID=UPI0024905CA6|nr:T9SS type A sorting domain-containing protein [Aquimarina aggregata]
MKKIYTIVILLICFIGQPILYSQTKSGNTRIPTGPQLYKSLKIKNQKNRDQDDMTVPSQITDKAVGRIFYELDRTCDPKTRKVPQNIYQKEQFFTQQSRSLSYQGDIKKSSSNWKNRGPFNVGGRTRALAIDRTNENIILAGGVSGGLWRTEDGGQNWRRVTRRFQNPSITSIVQDPRPGHQNIWYYGGGERLGNSATLNSVTLYTGAGIYKSQDSGRTWELLNATADNSVLTVSPFDVVNSMAIDPRNGDLYVATFNGVHRSQDSGNSFQEVLAGGLDNRAEIIITPQGTLYASIADLDRGTALGGVFVSQDGVNWTRITENNPEINRSLRTLCAVNPLNENEVYIYRTFGFAIVENTLHKYNAIDNTFTNLSSSLPRRVAPIGGLDTQRGYNMVFSIHPTNPDFIIFGGTNLFRTTNGFRTEVANTPNNWIGGYSPVNDISIYPNNHPDMHALVFFPSNPNKVLNANDGGVFVTEDITRSDSFEEPVSWVSLNNGYITTQPYAISFDPESESDELLAGFQDNGTWHTDQTYSNSIWDRQFGGDGSYNAFADNGRTRYVSSQGGNVFRLNLNKNQEVESIAWVRPIRGDNFSFITPFVLDPNDDNVMYLPAGRSLFRNSNLDEVPAATNLDDLDDPTEINWSAIASVESILTPDGLRELNNITAIDVSTFPEANKVYFGTGQGQLYRMDFADLSSSEPVDIFNGKGLPENGFISSIHVDPNDSNKVVVAFSNYNIQSVFYSFNGGETWIDISGNLEENKDGTGNGPSVRWVSFLGNKNGLLAGTSSGLYYTDRIIKNNVVWRLENTQIGDGVVMQVRTRKDGLAVLAVHGNGVFSKKFDVTPPRGEKTLFVNKEPEDIQLSIEDTPQFLTLDLSDVFREENNSKVRISVESSDTNREFIGYEFFRNKLQIFFFRTNSQVSNPDKEGEATIRLTATSGIQKVATEFNVRVFQEPILDTFDPNRINYGTGLPAAEVPFDIITLEENVSNEMANRFTIPVGEKWNIERMKMLAVSDALLIPGLSIPGDQARLRIYKDDNGKPGEQILDVMNTLRINPVFEDINIVEEFDLVLPNKIELNSGKYWLSFVRIEEVFFINNISWLNYIVESDDPIFNNLADAQARGTNLEPGLPSDWDTFTNTQSTSFPNGIPQIPEGKATLVFSLFGDVETSDNNKLLNLTLKRNITVYPNPTKGIFDLKFVTKPDEDISIRIIDISGQQIASYTFDKTQTNYSIDASKWGTGIYIAKINGNKTKMTAKIIRK